MPQIFGENTKKGLKIGKNGGEGAVLAKFWEKILGRKSTLGEYYPGKKFGNFEEYIPLNLHDNWEDILFPNECRFVENYSPFRMLSPI